MEQKNGCKKKWMKISEKKLKKLTCVNFFAKKVGLWKQN